MAFRVFGIRYKPPVDQVMRFERLLDDLRNDEGFRAYPYEDCLGRITIGFGNCYINGEKVTMKSGPVSFQTGLEMLMGDAYAACIDAQSAVENFDQLDAIRQEILVNMAFNLGGRGLMLFKKMRAHIEKRNWPGAAREMKNSKWFQQTGNRALRLYLRMITGKHE